MNKLLQRELLDAYNDSGKDKKKFLSLAQEYTGLTKLGLMKGEVKDFISTLVFKENIDMKRASSLRLLELGHIANPKKAKAVLFSQKQSIGSDKHLQNELSKLGYIYLEDYLDGIHDDHKLYIINPDILANHRAMNLLKTAGTTDFDDSKRKYFQ